MTYVVERMIATTEAGDCVWCRRPADTTLGEVGPWDGLKAFHPDVQLHEGCIEAFGEFVAGQRFVTDLRDYEVVVEPDGTKVGLWRWRQRRTGPYAQGGASREGGENDGG
jgi:hypothetical protein